MLSRIFANRSLIFASANVARFSTTSSLSYTPTKKTTTTTTTTTKMPKEGSGRRRKDDVDGVAPAPTKKGKKKDPNAPKRSLSAYMFFANEKRDEVRNENPGISFGQIGKVLGEKWKALSEEEKIPFVEKAETDKKRYEAEMNLYKNNKQEVYAEPE
ncbi:uncharacterized protein SAPINGB_P005493 [Magnusiomyces paraingens]|uniref:HMG box domain-containing protein n=1 Tax=Magnusiomyces paraingens TaxID=2606893 RepID=A0A5E8C588_9ASCO|nr:uncharacterized protein SAPINGB_P005493 [Saprochaete ingens]VVT57018.1 unnamed protein product [Saprochaete ingens]